ncbi:DUF5082 domain-containing protein [Oceanobacillus caeni]|uniref:DUF5082 domain-containing protein n=1 Tax=Oceanobacillus caeni TaxID=405946 RepID=UPI00214A06B6|nr:DUF5082 domain-containing protein [Oceanobacillus caeni]MCR1836241.1 DUF5082 domain-containing protein [Oceanobacillus caeni]
MSTSMGLLHDQVRTVMLGMANTKENISDLEDKIARLEEAVKELQTSIEELKTTKTSIDGLTIDESSWKGENKDTFEEQYSEYQEAVKNYVSNTEDAKETMEQEIANYETSRTNYLIGLENLKNSLDSLHNQISKLAEADKE